MSPPFSSKDSRKVPNGCRTIAGSVVYDVQVSDNPAIPPLDSRKSKPVDSRVAAIAPQNNRTPGLNGPGN
jgi:hypothetical protein